VKVFLDIIKWLFTAVGWLLLLILFLLIFPVRADILLEDAVFHLDIRYLFLKLNILPAKENKDKKKEEEEEKQEEQEEKEEAGGEAASTAGEEQEHGEKTETTDQEPLPELGDPGKDDAEEYKTERKVKSVSDTISKIVTIIRRIEQPAYWTVRMLLRAVHIKDFSVVVCVTGEDPASVGFRSGLQWSFIGSFMSLINRLFAKHVSYGEVTVLPCFNMVEERKEKLRCSISTQPIIVLLIALGFGLGYLIELIKDLISRGGKKNVK
jgi:hypothetical protein